MIRKDMREKGGLAAAFFVSAFSALGPVAAQDSCPASLAGVPIGFNIESLDQARDERDTFSGLTAQAMASLIERADKALTTMPPSVTDKERLPPSGDAHDYTSLAVYWWPDPSKPDGLPYIQKDGEFTPERNGPNYDKVRSNVMRAAVFDLSLAAYLTGDEQYARKAGEFIRVWFIDPKTKMNPNLNFAQAIPGRNEGRDIGIIDSRMFQEVIDASLLLERLDMLDDDISVGLRQWVGAYAAWLIQSPNGQSERGKKNNHGVFYDSQLAHFVIYAGRCDIARRIIKDTRSRAVSQIKPTGVMPEEARRTRSLHYHAFTAEAFLRLSLMAERLGEDLYDYELAASGSPRDAVHNLADYVGRYDEWPFERLNEKGTRTVWLALARSLLVDPDDAEVRAALAKADDADADEDLLLIAYGDLQQ